MLKVKMGFVGAGFMGQVAHLANYAVLDNCELTALAEGRSQLSQKVARKYGIAKSYANHRQLADDKDVEAVAAILPFSLNYGVVKDLLLAGKHVLTETPMALSYEECTELAALAEKRRLIYQVGYMKRHDTGVKLAKRHLQALRQSQEFGKLQMVRVWCFSGDWLYGCDQPLQTEERVPDYGTTGKGLSPDLPKQLQGFFGRLLNIDSHLTNLLRFLLEEDFTIRSVNHYNDKPFILVAETTSGVPITFEGGNLSARPWHEGIQCYFSDALVEIRPPAPMAKQSFANVEIYKAGTVQEIVHLNPPPGWAFLQQARHFIASVLGQEAPISPALEAAKEVDFAEQVVRKA